MRRVQKPVSKSKLPSAVKLPATACVTAVGRCAVATYKGDAAILFFKKYYIVQYDRFARELK